MTVSGKSNTLYIQLLIRLVALVYIFAFADSLLQFDYLIGTNGSLPVSTAIKDSYDCQGWWGIVKKPGLFWISSSNNFITAVFIIGMLCSAMVMLGFLQTLNGFIAFACWLSVVNGGGDFFIYVWDTLLLEAGFVAFLVSGLYQSPKYSKLSVVILWALVFRFWLSMGLEKLFYNNSLWLNGSYMQYYFQNQPMPTALAFYVHHLPAFLHSIFGYLVLFVEVCVPFFIFFKNLRTLAFFLFLFISICIQLLGNYAWFNILSVIIAIPLFIGTPLGDRIFVRIGDHLKHKFRPSFVFAPRLFAVVAYFQLLLQSILFIMILFPLGNRYLNFLNYYNYQPSFLKFSQTNIFTRVISYPVYLGSDFKIANPYGVFKGIAVKRWEIQFELLKDSATTNGDIVQYYYKPGFTDNKCFFAPHFPRLEQQLFYEAQQGSFFLNYTPNNQCSPHSCWTSALILNLMKNKDYRAPGNKESNYLYNLVKVNVYSMTFSDWQKYRISGNMWNKSLVFSFLLTRNSVNCPLIDFDYYQKYNKHKP